MSAEDRARVKAFYVALWSDTPNAALSEYLAPHFVEHQYTAGFTREGLTEYVAGRRREHPEHQVVIHHVLNDEDLVFLLVEEKLGDNLDYARGELYRLKDGLITEHWGSSVLDAKDRKNQNGTFDGAQVDRTRDYARRFAATFEELDRRGFDCQELSTFSVSRTTDYKQHSPKGGDGRTGLVEILSRAKDAGIKTSMERYRTLCDGDFLVSHRLYDTQPAHPLMSRIYTFEVFRINADGQAVEHWDVMDAVPSADLLARMR